MDIMQIWQVPPALRLVTFSPHFSARYLRWHNHPFYELALVLGGRCTWRLRPRRRVLLDAGEALLLKPRVLHREDLAPSQSARVAWIGFDFKGDPPGWCGRVIKLKDDASEIAGYFDVIAREHHHTDARSRSRIDLALQSLFLLLERCADGSRRPVAVESDLNPRQTHIVESAGHYFRHNLQNPLRIAQVAAYYSLCPAHFSSLFQRRHRVTPRGFLRQARLQRAADLLIESEFTLKEIAAQCGFVDAAHFCRSFKEDRCLTPGHFRTQMRKHAAVPELSVHLPAV